MTLVVDAGVAAKWVLPEEDAERAASLRNQPDDILAPSLIVAEIGNAVWKRVMANEISPADAVEALDIATSLLTRLVPMRELSARATEIAIALRHPIYDCFYLALAEREHAPMFTTDRRLLNVTRNMTIEVRRP